MREKFTPCTYQHLIWVRTKKAKVSWTSTPPVWTQFHMYHSHLKRLDKQRDNHRDLMASPFLSCCSNTPKTVSQRHIFSFADDMALLQIPTDFPESLQ